MINKIQTLKDLYMKKALIDIIPASSQREFSQGWNHQVYENFLISCLKLILRMMLHNTLKTIFFLNLVALIYTTQIDFCLPIFSKHFSKAKLFSSLQILLNPIQFHCSGLQISSQATIFLFSFSIQPHKKEQHIASKEFSMNFPSL